MSQNEPSVLSQIRYSRGLSSWQAISRGLGVVAATAMFVLLDQVTGIAGSLTTIAFLLAASLAVLNCLGYAELAVSSPRSAGAYTLVREATTQEILPFITGWVLTISSLGISALLAQGAARYLTALLADLLVVEIPVTWTAIALVIITIVLHALQFKGQQHLAFTVPMLVVLVALTVLSIGRHSCTNFPVRSGRADQAMIPLLASFVGLEIITSYQQEIRRRVFTLPPSLLLTPVLAGLIGIVVVIAVVSTIGCAEIAADQGLLVKWGERVAGHIGQTVVLTVGFLALSLSLARTISMVVRQVFVMSRDGFWPDWLQRVHPRYGVPIRSIMLVGLTVAGTVWVPCTCLSRITSLLYVITLALVNLALAQRRRRSVTPSSERTRLFASVEQNTGRPQSAVRPHRRFALPFHPWIPALTVAVDLLVVSLWDATSIILGIGCLTIGAVVYLAYARGRHVQAQQGVTVFTSVEGEAVASPFRVLVPIANPTTAEALLRLAGQLAQARNGDILALQVLIIPESLPFEVGRRRAANEQTLLERALTFADQERLRLRTMTRVARSVAQGILETAHEENVDLIVMGWKDPSHGRGTSLGTIPDAVLRDAPCEVMVVRGTDQQPIRKILVPTAGGPHAQAAARLATLLAKTLSAEVSYLYVQSSPATEQQIDSIRENIVSDLKKLNPDNEPNLIIETASSVVEGIVKTAKAHDMLLLGVSEENLLDRVLFGSVPLQVAYRVPRVSLVQGDRGITGVWSRRLLRLALDTLPRLSRTEQLEVRQALSQAARPGINYFVLIVLSCIIAALGLLQNSPAVVIGAMLVAPLMSPVLAFSLGMVLGDLRLLRFSFEAIFKGIALALVLAVFIGLLTPTRSITAEMLARAQPTLLDLAVALASGLAGAYAVARKNVSAALPGVAIAAALMPPLVTVGLGLAVGSPHVAGGALLLFITNIAAISLAGSIVFILLGVSPGTCGPESRRRLQMRLIASLIVLAVIAIPLGVIMARTVQDAARENTVRSILTEQVVAEGSELTTIEIERTDRGLKIVATVRSEHEFDQESVKNLTNALNDRLDSAVELRLVILPTVRSVIDQ